MSTDATTAIASRPTWPRSIRARRPKRNRLDVAARRGAPPLRVLGAPPAPACSAGGDLIDSVVIAVCRAIIATPLPIPGESKKTLSAVLVNSHGRLRRGPAPPEI